LVCFATYTISLVKINEKKGYTNQKQNLFKEAV
jgi:hypothetical protein